MCVISGDGSGQRDKTLRSGAGDSGKRPPEKQAPFHPHAQQCLHLRPRYCQLLREETWPPQKESPRATGPPRSGREPPKTSWDIRHCWRRLSRGPDYWLTQEQTRAIRGSSLLPVLWRPVCPPCTQWECLQGRNLEIIRWCSEQQDWICDQTYSLEKY